MLDQTRPIIGWFSGWRVRLSYSRLLAYVLASSYQRPSQKWYNLPPSFALCLFVCLGLTSLWNIWGHITTVPACSSDTLTNVLPHRNAMPQTQDTTSHPVTVYRHGADLSLCYPLMWNVTLEYTATHFNVLGETRPGNPSPTFHTHQRTLNLMLSLWPTVGSSVESNVPTGSWTRALWCTNPVRYPLAHCDFLALPFRVGVWQCKSKDQEVCETVYGDMHLKDLLRSIIREGYCIPVLDFYLLLYGLRSTNQSTNQQIHIKLYNIELDLSQCWPS